MLENKSFKPIKILVNSLLIIGLMSLSSCLGNKTQNQATQIRIVDLNGNPKPVKRIVPEGNAQILASQQNQMLVANESILATNNINKTPQNYPTDSANSLQQSNGQIFNQDIASIPVNNPNQQNEAKPIEAAVLYDLSSEDSQTNNETKEKEITSLPEDNGKNTASSSPKTKFKLKVATIANISPKAESGTLIQIGYFSSYNNAKKALEKSKKISTGKIEEVNLENGKNYRVFLGPFSNKQKVRSVLKKAKKSGYKDAFIVR